MGTIVHLTGACPSPSRQCGGHFLDASQDPAAHAVHQVGTGGDVEARSLQHRLLTRHPEPSVYPLFVPKASMVGIEQRQPLGLVEVA